MPVPGSTSCSMKSWSGSATFRPPNGMRCCCVIGRLLFGLRSGRGAARVCRQGVGNDDVAGQRLVAALHRPLAPDDRRLLVAREWAMDLRGAVDRPREVDVAVVRTDHP